MATTIDKSAGISNETRPNETSSEVTPEELLSIDCDDSRPTYELIDGQLKEMHVSSISSWVAKRIINLLQPLEDDGRAFTFPADAGIQCFEDQPRKVLKPDGMVVAAEDLPDGPTPGYLKVVPELVVEVISDHDLARNISRKVSDYQNAGVKIIWVVEPFSRTASVYRGRESVELVQDDGFLTAAGVYDDVKIPLQDVLPTA